MDFQIPSRIEQRLEAFWADEAAQARFYEALQGASLGELIDPTARPAAFPRTFTDRVRGKRVVYPLLRHADRIELLGVKLEQLARGRARSHVHPAFAYLQLSEYQEHFRPGYDASRRRVARERENTRTAGRRKKKAARSRAGTRTASARPKRRLTAAQQRDEEAAGHFRRLGRLKKVLRVPATFARARSLDALRALVLGEFSSLVGDYLQLEVEATALRTEVETYRNPEYMHPEVKRTLDDVVSENTRQKIQLQRERRRAETLEQEVHRLAEQILSAPSKGPATTEELELLRQEHRVLGDKYDALVSKNIELVNRLELTEGPASLEGSLDLVRNKINSVLRTSQSAPDEVLLRRLQEELVQLIRARTYLGRALYDMGLLYLRMDRRADAVRELRAARELGIEDPETNRLLNS